MSDTQWLANAAANVRVSIPVRSFSIRICSTRSRTPSEELCCVADPDMHKDSVTRAAQHTRDAGRGLHRGETELSASVTRVRVLSLRELAKHKRSGFAAFLDSRDSGTSVWPSIFAPESS